MSILKCKMCGGDLEVTEDMKIVECDYCGTKQTVPNADNEKKVNLFNRANRLRMASEFDKAAGIYENIVAEALVKQGYSLYYYKRDDSTLEEDFFVRTRKSLVPVEVKAVSGRSKSLRTLIESDHYPDIKYGIKLSKKNIGFENNIYTFPYFCSFLLKRYLQNVEW